MEVVRRYWLSALAGLLALFLLFLAVAIGFDDEPGTSTAERLFGIVVTGATGLALIAGLWGLRTSRVPPEAAYTGIVIGLVGAAIWFWMLFPPLIAGIVLWFGVIRGGLARELQPADRGIEV